MTLQEIIKYFENLSENEQASLLEILIRKRQEKHDYINGSSVTTEKVQSYNGETFWEMTLRFCERMERERIEFTDEDFADLRDTNPGREVEL